MRTKTIIVLLAVLLAVSTPAYAVSKAESGTKRSDSIWLPGRGRLYSWNAVGRNELVIWATPSRPYLVEIWRPFTSLRFAHYIGVTSTAGRVTKFDRVIVDGQRLPIRSIRALDRETARSLRWSRT